MDKIKAITAHQVFVPAMCLLFAGLIIFCAGPYFSFAGYIPLASFIAQLILFVLITSVYGIYRYIKHLKSQMKQDKLVAEMTENDGASDAIDAESAALKDKFKAAFAMLKNTKGAPISLLDIPWYMIIGSPGSGKTTLLSNSGLSFPLAAKLQNKALQGVGGTKNCDWWITQDAVLLDTAGRYTSQDSFQKVDESGWQNFLSLIKRYRKKPISGLLVSFSMADLISMNEYELSQHVYQLKQRIAEVNDSFKTRFPIYVVITKADMLAGFTQFFDTFSHKEREQILGITFQHNDSLNADVPSVFAQKFHELISSITRRQWPRMSLERDAQRKALIYSFSDQIASVKPALTTIMTILSGQDRSLSTGIVRGLYFTSGTQSGAPIDRIIARVSQIFGFKRNTTPLWNNDQRSYFIKDLLQQVVFAEADRFGSLAGYDLNKKRLKLASLVLFSLLSIILCAGLFLSFSHNADYLAQAKRSVDKWLQQHNDQNNQAEIRQYLPALSDFTNDINGLKKGQEMYFSGLGLSQKQAVQNALNASYKRLLQTVLMPYIQQQIESQLQDPTKPTLQYQALKSYLMLAEPQRRNNPFIADHLIKNINLAGDFSESEYLQLSKHIHNAIVNNLSIEATNPSLILAVRRNLSTQSLGEIYYRQISDKYLTNPANYISLAQLAGSGWRTVLSTELNDIQTISRFYTPEMFAQVRKTDITQFVEKLADDAWILGPDSIIDKNTIAKQIETLYVKDYIDKWQVLLNSVSIRSFADAISLRTGLQALSAADSPIFVLLESVSDATKLVSLDIPIDADSKIGQNVARGFNEAQQRLNANGPDFLVTARFSRLHELMSKDQNLATEQQMSALLRELNVSLSFQLQNPQTATESKSHDALQGFGYLQIAPLNRWIEELVSGIKIVQSRVKKTQLSNLWQSQLFLQCKAIESNKYPFDFSSQADASISDLVLLFSPTGAVAQFFNTNLASLVNMQTSPWQWKPQVQASYQFDPKVLPFFERIFAIQRSLFATNPQQPKLVLSMTPVFLDPKLSRFRMSMYGTNLSYQFGRPTSTLVTWPPENPAIRNQISYVRRDGSEIIENQEGLFSLFRLIDKDNITRVLPNKVKVTFTKNDFKAVYEIAAESPIDPLVLSNLSSFNCLSGF
jgi:type VI secretion system protein ImpL